MQITCGTDIIEIERIKESIKNMKDRFLNKVYTDNEIRYCESKKEMRYQHFAARFAAKEAVFKAVSGILDDKYEIGWRDIEILNDNNGRPRVNFINIKLDTIKQCDISISHCREYAIANVIIMID